MFLDILDLALSLHEIDPCCYDLFQVKCAGFILVPVSVKSVRGKDKFNFSGFILYKIAAGAAYCALKRILESVPVRLAFEDQAGMAVRAETLIGIAHPMSFFNRSLDRFNNILAHLMSALKLLGP